MQPTRIVATTVDYVSGSSWNSRSDRATKENFTPVDKRAILNQVAVMPLQECNLKSQDPSIPRIGPVAQTFAAFGYGETHKATNMKDADGIALAAIQGHYQVVKERSRPKSWDWRNVTATWRRVWSLWNR